MNRYDNGINDWNKAESFAFKAQKRGLMSKHGFPDLPARSFTLEARTCL